MKIIKQYAKIINMSHSNPLEFIEQAARTCYKSEPKGNPEDFVKMLLKRGHESTIEHVSVSVKIITDRGISHEIVRHRLASYSQESTRYCNYGDDKFGKELTFILPKRFYEFQTFKEGSGEVASMQHPMYARYYNWKEACEEVEKHYLKALELGDAPQEARDILDNSLKTEMVMTCNLREWRLFFKLRTAPAAHPQMQDLMKALLLNFKEKIPVIFDDL